MLACSRCCLDDPRFLSATTLVVWDFLAFVSRNSFSSDDRDDLGDHGSSHRILASFIG